MNSMRTTILGIATILAALSGAAMAMFDSDLTTNPDWNVVGAALAAGIGLLMDVTITRAASRLGRSSDELPRQTGCDRDQWSGWRQSQGTEYIACISRRDRDDLLLSLRNDLSPDGFDRICFSYWHYRHSAFCDPPQG